MAYGKSIRMYHGRIVGGIELHPRCEDNIHFYEVLRAEHENVKNLIIEKNLYLL